MRMCKWVPVPGLCDRGWGWGQRAQTTEQPRSRAPAGTSELGAAKPGAGTQSLPLPTPRSVWECLHQGLDLLGQLLQHPALPRSSRSLKFILFLLLQEFVLSHPRLSAARVGLEAGRTGRREEPQLWEAVLAASPCRMMLFSSPGLRLVIIESCSLPVLQPPQAPGDSQSSAQSLGAVWKCQANNP